MEVSRRRARALAARADPPLVVDEPPAVHTQAGEVNPRQRAGELEVAEVDAEVAVGHTGSVYSRQFLVTRPNGINRFSLVSDILMVYVHLQMWHWPPPMARIEARMEPEPNSGCWIWLGATPWGRGYATMTIHGKPRRVHTVMWEEKFGAPPPGLVPDHLCRVPRCINPDHLEWVTNRVNILRGIGPTAINARKTHCPRGHALTGDNIYNRPDMRRNCRRCNTREARRRIYRVDPVHLSNSGMYPGVSPTTHAGPQHSSTPISRA